MNKKGIVFSLILVLLILVFTAACTPDADDTAIDEVEPGSTNPSHEEDEVEEVLSDEPSGQLIVGIQKASGNFNPLYYSTGYDGYVIDLVFQRLIRLDENGEFQAEVAESWEISDDKLSITFKMREDVVFSDGEPLTADDVVFTYKVLADPSYTGRYGEYVKDLKGFDEYYAGETDTFEGVVALNDYEVQFNFTEVLRSNLDYTTFDILPEHYYGEEFTPGDTSRVEAITTESIGSGPYVVDNFCPDQLVHLTRNDSYIGDGYLIKDVVLKFVDETTDILELTSGDIDLLPEVIDPNKIKQARDSGFEKNTYPRSGYGHINFNHQWGPTAEKEVRQALYYAFDREELVNSYFLDEKTGEVLANTQSHAFSQVSWVIDDSLLDEINDYEFDLDKANELLDEAGWKKNTDGIREKNGEALKLNIAAGDNQEILNTIIPMWERDWGEGLGIELNVEYLDFNSLVDYIIYSSDDNVDKWSLYFMAVAIDTMDPHTHYTSLHSNYIGNGQNNILRYNNPEVDQLLDEGKAIMEIEEAKPIYGELVKILNEDAAMMPVYSNICYDLYNDKLVDFETDSLWGWQYAIKDARVIDN